jgi:hypothetical protein
MVANVAERGAEKWRNVKQTDASVSLQVKAAGFD